MDNLTLGLIYAVKHSGKSAKESIINFLSEYTGTPKDAKRQQENFKDVFPEQQKKYAERDGKMDIDTEAIVSALRLSHVQENGKYINGFREWNND